MREGWERGKDQGVSERMEGSEGSTREGEREKVLTE